MKRTCRSITLSNLGERRQLKWAPRGDVEKAHAASANTHFNQGGGSERACSDLISLIMKWDICALHSQKHRHGRVRRRLRQDFSSLAAARSDVASAGGAGASSAMALTPFLRLHLRIWTMADFIFYFGSLFGAEAARGCKMGLAVRLGDCLSFN